MKKKVYRFTRPATPVVVMAVFLAAIFFTWTNLSIAASTDPKTPPKARPSHVERTEARIKNLQTALKITPEQQGAWNAFVQVMEDNAKDMDELSKARTKKHKDMNAVEDLKNYCQFSETHLAGMKKMIPAFEALYNSMSDEQKKNADSIFKMGKHGQQRKQAKKQSK
ncbi:MAG: Spy/CpxP family protein refolding chaperone [Thermodesulfobacteriota bacterium]